VKTEKEILSFVFLGIKNQRIKLECRRRIYLKISGVRLNAVKILRTLIVKVKCSWGSWWFGCMLGLNFTKILYRKLTLA